MQVNQFILKQKSTQKVIQIFLCFLCKFQYIFATLKNVLLIFNRCIVYDIYIIYLSQTPLVL